MMDSSHTFDNWIWRKGAVVLIYLVFAMMFVFGILGYGTDMRIKDAEEHRRKAEDVQREAILKLAKESKDQMIWHHNQMRHFQDQIHKELMAVHRELKRKK